MGQAVARFRLKKHNSYLQTRLKYIFFFCFPVAKYENIQGYDELSLWLRL
jgi:hypothetical protein